MLAPGQLCSCVVREAVEYDASISRSGRGDKRHQSETWGLTVSAYTCSWIQLFVNCVETTV